MENKFLAYTDYMDQDGQITIDKNPGKWSTGNGLMHTGLFMCLLSALNKLTNIDKDHFKRVVKACEKEPGIYYKNPNRPDENSHDDLLGVYAGSKVCELSYTNDIQKYGLKHGLIWNVDDKLEFRDFFGRFIFYMFFIYNIFNIILFIYYRFKKTSSYTILLEFMIIYSLSQNSKLFKNLLIKRLKTNSLSIEMARYFKSSEHPLVGLSKQLESLYD